LRDRIDDIRALGAELVLIGSGAPHFAAAFREDFELDCPVLVDESLEVYSIAGLERSTAAALSPRMALSAVRALRAGHRQTAVQGDVWQLGGVLVIRAGGRVVYRHASTEAGDHAPIEEVLAALAPDAAPRAPAEEPSSVRRALGTILGRIVDPLIVPSFDRTGYRIHSLAYDPRDLDVDLAGRRCVVTGANSGIGFETARALARLGAEVVLVCRSRERGERAAEAIRSAARGRVRLERADLSDLRSVAALAETLGDAPIDALIHNAGVLPDERIETADGLELTFATHVAGPHQLTRLLRSRLEASTDARVIFVSSGGMYTRRLRVDDVDWHERDYDGVVAYAQTKRMQVALARRWAEELAATSVRVFSMHPGWADTPAVRSSLPRFHHLTKAILRTPAEGADTVVWLAACPRSRVRSGGFYFDRAERSPHYLPFTAETADDREQLWKLCERLASRGRDEDESPGGK
jgi:NAD(P)-dependent dehydrogenase (short-subunit alcohol dehydrogenase family)